MRRNFGFLSFFDKLPLPKTVRKGFRYEWHTVKLNTLGFKVLRRKTPAHLAADVDRIKLVENVDLESLIEHSQDVDQVVDKVLIPPHKSYMRLTRLQ